MIRSASSAKSIAFLTPIFSTTSSVWRMPAVSIIFSGIPCILTCSSSVSLVVPAISVTMALFSPRSTFINEDFPAFGFPRITVLIPSLTRRPLSAESSIFWSSAIYPRTWTANSSPKPSAWMCSGSSRAASINAILPIIPFLNFSILFLTLPLNWFRELSSAISLFALITSITASAWDRSIRPFKKARFVNSPGSASLAPYFNTVSRSFFITTTPPWQSISTTSSLV